MSDAVTPAPRERGWRRVLPALVLFVIVPAVPLFRVFVPIEQTFVVLGPAIAACTLVGWWAGGRLSLALIWLVLAGWMLSIPVAGSSGYDALARGWAVLLAASFGLVCLLGARRPFFSRALAATGIALAVALVLRGTVASGGASLEGTMTAEFTRRIDASFAEWKTMTATKEWQEFAAKRPGMAQIAEDSERQLRALPAATARVFPALLGLESLAALALAWSLYHRVSRARIGLPLAPLREFRFNDQLVWGLIAGITLVVLPTLGALRGVGINLLVFFGALYALRGFGVLTWFLAPGRLVTALLIGFAILAWPLLGIFALGLGLGDTWLD
jgi:hypothetical protein